MGKNDSFFVHPQNRLKIKISEIPILPLGKVCLEIKGFIKAFIKGFNFYMYFDKKGCKANLSQAFL